MTLAQVTELRQLALDLERLGLKHSADRVRAVLAGDAPGDERPCPIQDQGGIAAVPWGLAEVLYAVYAADGHGGQSLERLAERGGFGRGELGMLAVGMYGADGRRPVRGYERRMPILDLYEAARRAE